MTGPRYSLRISRFLGALVVVCCLLPPVRSAWAAEDLCRSDRACSELDNSGAQLYRAKQYKNALELFVKAFAIRPEPRLILNTGRCHHWLHEYDTALQYYAQYNALVPAPTPEFRKRLTQFMQEAEAGKREQSLTVTEPARPIYRKWWFWTAIGVVAAAAAVGGVYGATAASQKDYSPTTRF